MSASRPRASSKGKRQVDVPASGLHLKPSALPPMRRVRLENPKRGACVPPLQCLQDFCFTKKLPAKTPPCLECHAQKETASSDKLVCYAKKYLFTGEGSPLSSAVCPLLVGALLSLRARPQRGDKVTLFIVQRLSTRCLAKPWRQTSLQGGTESLRYMPPAGQEP